MGTKRNATGAGTLAAAIVVAALAWHAPLAQAVEVAGIDVAETVDVAGARLRLNGAGARTLYVVRTYVAALYVAHPAARMQALLQQPGPRRLSLTMLASLSAAWVVERFVDAIRANTRADEFARLEPRMQQLVDALRGVERLEKGERVDFDAIAGSLRVSVGGVALGIALSGDDLFDAMLRALVGERPLDDALKRAILGESGVDPEFGPRADPALK